MLPVTTVATLPFTFHNSDGKKHKTVSLSKEFNEQEHFAPYTHNFLSILPKTLPPMFAVKIFKTVSAIELVAFEMKLMNIK